MCDLYGQIARPQQLVKKAKSPGSKILDPDCGWSFVTINKIKHFFSIAYYKYYLNQSTIISTAKVVLNAVTSVAKPVAILSTSRSKTAATPDAKPPIATPAVNTPATIPTVTTEGNPDPKLTIICSQCSNVQRWFLAIHCWRILLLFLAGLNLFLNK